MAVKKCQPSWKRNFENNLALISREEVKTLSEVPDFLPEEFITWDEGGRGNDLSTDQLLGTTQHN